MFGRLSVVVVEFCDLDLLDYAVLAVLSPLAENRLAEAALADDFLDNVLVHLDERFTIVVFVVFVVNSS